MKNLLKQIFVSEIPIIKTFDDLQDPRARKIAQQNFNDFANILSLYSELEKRAGDQIEIDSEEVSKSLEFPKEIKQLIAGAVLNYELTQRKMFKIRVDKGRSAVIERKAAIDYHEFVANTFVATAERIYRFQEAHLK